MTTPMSFFDERADAWEETCYPPRVRSRLSDLIPEFGAGTGERILDLGTGPGVLIPYLRTCVGNSGRICAVDISFQMVRQARKKPLTSGDLALQGDAGNLPFGNRVFDRVICFAAFPHFTDPDRALKEMARVTRPGGWIVIAHLMSREELAKHHAAHSSVAGDVLPDKDRMRGLFETAGLSPPEIIDIPGRYLARAEHMRAV